MKSGIGLYKNIDLNAINVSPSNYLPDLDRENLINSLNDELIIEGIREQINYPEFINKGSINYIEEFDTKIEFLKSNYSNDNDMIERLTNVNNDFYMEVWSILKEKYKLNDITLESSLEHQTVYALYNFLSINLLDNLIQFSINFIKNNHKSLVARYTKSCKDIFIAYYKSFNLSKECAIILVKLKDILSLIKEMELDSPNEIISLILNKTNHTTDEILLKDLFLEDENGVIKYKFSDEFTEIFLNLMTPDTVFFNTIYSKVHEILFNTYINNIVGEK